MSIDPFAPYTLAGIQLKNRIIRSATHEGMADERGVPTDALTRKYVQLAQGGIGAIITGYAGVQADGRCSYYRMLMIDHDECVPAYGTLVDAVHAHDTPIVLQLGHAGRQTRSKVTGLPTVAPSAIRDKYFNEDVPKELSESEIERIIENFAHGALRAQAAGFDAVQIHAAHGYLLAQFLSAYTNRRRDRWGGSIECRFRIVGEILRRIGELAPGFPVLAKINASDCRPNGMRLPEAIEIAKLLAAAGCASIEVSRGVNEDGFYFIPNEHNPVDAVLHYNFKAHAVPPALRRLLRPLIGFELRTRQPTRLYNVDAAAAIRAAVPVPVMVVGGIRTIEDVRSILDGGRADLVSLCRPLILEPTLVKHWQDGTRTGSRCIACNYCALGIEQGPVRCHLGKLPGAPAVA